MPLQKIEKWVGLKLSSNVNYLVEIENKTKFKKAKAGTWSEACQSKKYYKMSCNGMQYNVLG